jgi:DNA-binding NarL/FixJ family response regulator
VLQTGQEDNQDSALTAAPGWVSRLLLHTDVVAGHSSADHALDVISRSAPLDSPAASAQILHLKGLKANDPQMLMKAGQDLAALGYFASARHALEHARAGYLAVRSATKAKEADESLGALGTMTLAGFYAGPSLVAVTRTPRNSEPSPTAPGNDPSHNATLTPRELDVCRLVAKGLTNSQIASRLFLSVRTVESHVLQARGKLGAAKRRDLPAALLAHGLS